MGSLARFGRVWQSSKQLNSIVGGCSSSLFTSSSSSEELSESGSAVGLVAGAGFGSILAALDGPGAGSADETDV